MHTFTIYRSLWMLVILLLFSGCAHHAEIPREEIHSVFTVQDLKDSPAVNHSPLFLAYDYRSNFNRIGRPSAEYDEAGKEHIYVDIDNPVMYHMVRNFSTDRGDYTNHIFRIHFPEVPFSIIPFHLSYGNNVGLIVVVTLDSLDRPLLVTTVHTCGCYLAIIPTSFLPSDAYPEQWRDVPLTVYSERLPQKLDYMGKLNPKVLVHLRPNVHRVMDIEVIEESELHHTKKYRKIITSLSDMEELEKLPINGTTTNFYHEDGPLKGHVKDSVKIWESLFLGLISLDLYVGADKTYADTGETGNPFYTSLKPWNRNASDMWHFRRFLEFWGWKL